VHLADVGFAAGHVLRLSGATALNGASVPVVAALQLQRGLDAARIALVSSDGAQLIVGELA
jgi:hypothetical protein